jgi:3-oxoacyl-[acyl-carrier-protein] synthase-3
MDVFNFSVETVPVTIDAALRKNGLAPDDVDYFVLHQANKVIIDAIGGKMRIPREKIPTNIDRIGNTSSCGVPLLLEEVLDMGPAPGSKILLCGFGTGLSWGSTVLTVRASLP